MSLQNYRGFDLLEQYINYLLVIKGRSQNTAIEYSTDLLMFFSFLKRKRGLLMEGDSQYDLADIDIGFISSVTLNQMYAFISYCQTE